MILLQAVSKLLREGVRPLFCSNTRKKGTDPVGLRLPPTRKHRIRVLALLLALCAAAGLSGCELVAYVAQGFADHSIKASYDLADRPTLVMVDDPSDYLGGIGLDRAMASRIGFQLVEEDALTHVIDQDRVVGLATRLAEEYPQPPIDQIGKHLGAEQVVYVYVESRRTQRQAVLVESTVRLRVKVVDVAAGRRLFPRAADMEADPSIDWSRGLPVEVTLRQSSSEVDSRAEQRQMLARLTEQAAVRVAELFYSHPRQSKDTALD